MTTSTPTLNGVDTAALFATINAVGAQRDLASFQFRATSSWIGGTHSQSTIERFYGAGQEQSHRQAFTFDADHPAVLTGQDQGPTPVELVLVALASCLTAGIANIASARKIELRSVQASLEGDIDLQGILGLSGEVRNGYRAIRVSFVIDADASAQTIAELVDQSRARSAVFDVITNQVPVSIEVATV
jgi:uncharacterized OsmC-like protein